MSSPKAAAAKTRAPARPPAARPKAAAGAAGRPKPERPPTTGSSGRKRLAAEIERRSPAASANALSIEAMQALMAAVCRVYAAQVEAGEQVTAAPGRGGATPTDVMVTASGLLKAANLAVFELGMWQSWTGR